MSDLPEPQVPIDMAQLCAWLEEAGRLALEQYRQVQAVQLKPDGTPATAVDHAIEAFLLQRIADRYPTHRVLTEESGAHGGDNEITWVIDPLDGTRAFASGLPIWGISVGVLQHGEPLAGVFYLPALNELYRGDRGSAFFNERPLASRPSTDLDDPLAFLLVPSNSHLTHDIAFPRVRSLGSTAAHLAYVARGVAVGALTRRIKIWDLAGVLPMLRRAGIELRYLSGASMHIDKLLDGQPTPEPLLAAAPPMMALLRAMIHTR